MGRRAPGTVNERTAFGELTLVPDGDRARGWTLYMDGTPQSYVDLDDPEYLEFEYMRWMVSIVDTAIPEPCRARVLHVGGGGLTLPRYIAAKHPYVAQRVVERDPALLGLVRRMLPLPARADLRIRVADGRDVVEAGRPRWYDLVVTDAFAGGQVPAPLTTTEFAAAVSRVLRPGGWYALNLVDGPPLRFAKSEAATLREVFEDVCLITEPGVLRRRRYGNLVLVAGAELPIGALAAAAARDVFPARVVHGGELDRFVSGARPLTDADATDSPSPRRSLLRGAIT
ncbi:MAG TPA: fused MFS/spermidine synthase [Rugosimonospora sp.]|nr:fused MFS/spermidine synthase [Rugosimonospora sp.]